MTVKLVVKRKDLEAVRDDLKRVDCTFWACPDWPKPFMDMATCNLCQNIQELDRIIKKSPDEQETIDYAHHHWTKGHCRED